MASKINTNDPKHHKYTDVNKYQRKKINNNIIHDIYDKYDNFIHLKFAKIIIYLRSYYISECKSLVKELRQGPGKYVNGVYKKSYHRKYYAKASRLKYSAEEARNLKYKKYL